MMNLSTTYMGLNLKNPIVASSSPLTKEIDTIQRLQEAGAAAVVLFSLFEEQIKYEQEAYEYLSSSGSESSPEASRYFTVPHNFSTGPGPYLDHLHQASTSVDIPILGSLNGVTNEGWTTYAKDMQQAGAAGIELNIYSVCTDPNVSSLDVEQRYLDLVKAVTREVSIPVAVKLSPFFSSLAHMAQQLDKASVDALVLFNRFYQPDFDLDALEIVPTLELSNSSEIRLPLMWISILYGKLETSLGASTGVNSGKEVIKYIMAGADAVMTTSALLKHDASFVETLLTEMSEWMEQKEYTSVDQLRGSMSQASADQPTALERLNYLKVLESFRNPYTP